MSKRTTDNPEYPMADWREEVVNGDTLLGYDEWVRVRRFFDIQEWARSQGYEVPDRGRIRQDIVSEYNRTRGQS